MRATGRPSGRVNVQLLPHVGTALDELLADSKMSVTDLINRAVETYALLWPAKVDGAEVVVHYSDGSSKQVVI